MVWQLYPNELHFPLLLNHQVLGVAVLVFLHTSTNPATLFYSGNIKIFPIIVTLFILFIFFVTSKLISNLLPRQFLALASVFTRLQWMQWALVLALTLEEPSWDGTFEETHIHPEYGLPIWGGSESWALWQVPHCGFPSAGDRSPKLSRTRAWTWICSWPCSQQKVSTDAIRSPL